MVRYALKRVLLTIPVLIGVSLVTFAFIRAIPGDPALIIAGSGATPQDLAGIRDEFRLNDPLPVQYIRYVTNAVQGDLGKSIRTRDPVATTIFVRLGFTVQLTLLAILIGVVMGIVLGVIAATHQNGWLDSVVMVGALVGISMPSFWQGLLLLFLFAGVLHWLPSGGAEGPQYLVLPAVVLGASGASVIARFARSALLEVIRQDYIRTLRAHGVSEFLIVYKHALRNALNPVITVVGLQFGYLLGGAVVVETVFSLPGIGRLMVNAIFTRDYPVIQGGMLLVAVTFVAVNLLTDLAYAFVNPRIRYQ